MKEYGKIIYQIHNGYEVYLDIKNNVYIVKGQRECFKTAFDACKYIDQNLKTK